MLRTPSFTLGMEEEYLLIDRETRDLAADPPEEAFEACRAVLGDQVTHEFLRCQIEVGTPICQSVGEARDQLAHMRRCLKSASAPYGLALMAASTHPFAEWDRLIHTNKERYNALADDLKMVVARLVICGMHVHVGVEDDDLRIDLMQQLTYFVPHLLALTTSSPFWRGNVTGLKSYRLSVFDELPRTGLPEQFSSYSEYRRTISTLVKAGLLEDATKVWWDLRPSDKFPTLELRICDVCTNLEDAATVAAMFQSLARMLWRLRRDNQKWRSYSRFLIEENRWLAQRHGLTGSLVDFGRGEKVLVDDLIEELIDLLREDAEALGCLAELEHARTIKTRGTSADRQLSLYRDKLESGHSAEDALRDVVDFLVDETVALENTPAADVS
ncbi:MAG: carboxylate-amine ligase [Cohaesibacteraceae bacterium]